MNDRELFLRGWARMAHLACKHLGNIPDFAWEAAAASAKVACGRGRQGDRVGARITPSASHGTVRALFAYGSSGWQVMTPATGRFTTSSFPAAVITALGRGWPPKSHEIGFHPRWSDLFRLALRLRHLLPTRSEPVPTLSAFGHAFPRSFCCREVQLQLSFHSFDRNRLPSPGLTSVPGFAPVSRRFWYYAVL